MITSTSTPRPRLEILDFAKGCLITMVVFRHVVQFFMYGGNEPPWTDQVFKTLTMLHMPLFAMISGYFAFRSLEKRKNWLDTFTRDFMLVLPIFFLIGLKLLTIRIFAGDSNQSVGVFQFIRQVIGSALFSVWYLWALAGCDIIFQFMVRIKANKVWMISLFFLILLAIPDFWLFHYIKFIIPFYAFGYFVSKNGIDPQGSFSWKVILPFVAVFVVAWTLWTPACYVNTTKTHISSTTIIPILIRYFGGIGGGVTLFLVFRILQRHTGFTLFGKVASKIGRHSLTIYLLHILFVSYTSLLLFPKNYFVAFAIALVVVGICLLMEILILRIPFAPILLLGKKLKPAKS